MQIQFRTGRTGLGVESDRKRRAEEMAAIRVHMMQKRAKLSSQYHSRQRERVTERELEKDVLASQRVCFQLDREQVRDFS